MNNKTQDQVSRLPGIFSGLREAVRGSRFGIGLAAVLLGLVSTATAQTVPLAQVPLLAMKAAPGLVMLTMSRDQRLFYAAYNDSSDIDGDGVMDVGFKPSITYYGYFASDRCYSYNSGVNKRFIPTSNVSAVDGCASVSGGGRWHGNWLNWATMSRMDALRRVLYGGHRVFDPTTSSQPTILQGSYIPRDAHVWGKEYRPVAGRDLNIYKIENYTGLSAPNAGKQHLFIVKSEPFTVAPLATGSTSYPFPMPIPNLRVVTNADMVNERIWNWAAGDGVALGADNPNFVTFGGSIKTSTAYAIRVEVCVGLGSGSVREAGCTSYPSGTVTNASVWKPTGTLHEYGQTDALKFGLLTGSYQNNYSGGVVRRNIASFSEEVDPANGTWRNVTEGSASVNGIARTIDRLSIFGTDGSSYYCGASFTGPRNQGACPAWGSPVSEMMYEGLRYFSGKAAPSPGFINGLASTSSADSRLSLPLVGTGTSPWTNPYRAKSLGGSPICSKPVQMVIADPITSYDSDQVPGAYFPLIGGSASVGASDLAGWGGTTLQTISNELWGLETLGTRKIFIGQSKTQTDGNPTGKLADSFFDIRGHAPDGAQAQGSFYAAPIARFAKIPGLNIGNPTGTEKVDKKTGAELDTIAVALGSVVPRILMPSDINRTRFVTIVPTAKSVANLSIDRSPGAYQATGTITGFYLDSSFNTTGPTGPDYNASQNGGLPIMSFAVNFSDSDEGTDNESDAIVKYTIAVLPGGQMVVSISPVQTNIAGIQMQIGYSISGTGTNKDGLYLDMRTQASSQVYYLDTLTSPTLQDPAPNLPPYRINGSPLPTTPTNRTFTLNASGTASAEFLPHDPLWYAAKYGGAGILDSNGDPTNYFRVTNPANLPAQMAKAFRSAAALAAVASTSVVGVGQRSLGAAIYQANYDSLTWSSRLYAFKVETTGAILNNEIWEAASKLQAPAGRNLFLGRGGSATPVQLSSGAFAGSTLTAAEKLDFGSADIYEYLLGDKSKEERKGGGLSTLRNRGTTAGAEFGSVLGDVVNSDPQIIAKKDYGYGVTPADPSYAAFVASLTNQSLAVGSNDGFFHIFDAAANAAGGNELFGFMPQAARNGIKDLASPAYSHRFFVDGSIGLGHAKIAVPGDATAAWRSVAVGTGGAGAQTVFALHTPNNQTYTSSNVLWEINANTALPNDTSGASSIGNLGNVMGRPVIGKLNSGVWVAIFGNGYNSTTGTAKLIVVRLDTGAVLNVIPTNNALTGNGLGSTEVVLKADKTIEFVYGVDYKGNIWRFNMGAISGVGGWPSNAKLVYKTPAGRPITAEIKVGPATGIAAILGGKMVYFGTGSYLSSGDITATPSTQALYGIYDDMGETGTSPSNTTAAVAESTLDVMSISMPTAASDVRTTSTATVPWYNQSGKKGWVVPFSGTNVAAGERVIAPPVRFTVTGKVDAFLFTSIVPGTDECVASLDAWITGVDAMTGSYSPVFNGLAANSVKVTGGSPRGVFVLEDSAQPSLYISQTIFDGKITSTSYTSEAGGKKEVTINGVTGITRLIKIDLATPPVPPAAGAGRRQSWRQLK